MKKMNSPKWTQWRNYSLRLFAMTLILLSSIGNSSAQCLEGCRDTIFWFIPVNEVRPHIIDLIDNELKNTDRWERRRERAWLWLEEVMAKRDMFCEMQCGVGCYFFYLACAKLAALIDQEPEFARFLSEERYWNLDEVRQNGCIAAEFALAIRDQYRADRGTYEKELKKIDHYLWNRQLERFCPEPEPEPLADFVIGEYRVTPNKLFRDETVMVEAYVKNIGDRDSDQTVWLNWVPKEGHTGFSASVKGLRRNEGKWVTFDPYTFREIDGGFNWIRVNEQHQIEEKNYTNNEIAFEILVQDREIQPPVPTRYSDLYITLRHPEEGLPVVDIDKRYTIAQRSCVIYTHEFGLGVMRTAASTAADFQLFVRALLPFLQEHGLQLEDATIQLTGLADATRFQEGSRYDLPAGYPFIPGGRYFTKTGATPTMDNLTFVDENVELAYARAYVVKDQLMAAFGLTEDIPITIDESAQVGSRYRGARLQLCWSALEAAPVRDLEQVVHTVLQPEALLNAKPNVFAESESEEEPTVPEMKMTDEKHRKPTAAQADTVLVAGAEKGFHSLQREDLQRGQVLPIERIAFARNTAEIVSPNADSLMEEIADFIKRCPGVKFEIAGHTTTWCTTQECNRLSRERAQAIYNRLKGMGTPMGLVMVKGYGKTQPLQPLDESQAGQEKNQRVEMRVVGFVGQDDKTIAPR